MAEKRDIVIYKVCGTDLDKGVPTLCDWPGCSLTVTALVVAQTGLPRHKHHRATS